MESHNCQCDAISSGGCELLYDLKFIVFITIVRLVMYTLQRQLEDLTECLVNATVLAWVAYYAIQSTHMMRVMRWALTHPQLALTPEDMCGVYELYDMMLIIAIGLLTLPLFRWLVVSVAPVVMSALGVPLKPSRKLNSMLLRFGYGDASLV
jgi:hypothetical protein